MIPPKSELWRVNTLRRIDSISTLNDGFDAARFKIISILRLDSENITRTCREIPYHEWERGQDTSSIYYNLKNYKNPVYTIDNFGSVFVSPSDGTIYIYIYEYLTDEVISGLSTLDNTAVREDLQWNFPQQAVYAGILKSCMNIIQSKISKAVQEEEDQELLNLLNAQNASLEKLLSTEMQRLNIPFAMVGDG